VQDVNITVKARQQVYRNVRQCETWEKVLDKVHTYLHKKRNFATQMRKLELANQGESQPQTIVCIATAVWKHALFYAGADLKWAHFKSAPA